MQEQTVTLRDVRAEALALEYLVDLSSGHIELYKKSDPAIGFMSCSKAYTREAIDEAWFWLQMERHLIDKADEERSDVTARRIAEETKARLEIKTLLSYGLQILLMPFVAGCIFLLLTNSSQIGEICYFLIAVIQVIRLTRRYKNDK